MTILDSWSTTLGYTQELWLTLANQALGTRMQSGGQLRVSFSKATTAPEAWANLAPFSSKGPTPDGRVKPDLLAPGTLQSAYTNLSSGNTCLLQ